MKYNIQLTQNVSVEANNYEEAALKAVNGEGRVTSELEPKQIAGEVLSDQIVQKNKDVKNIIDGFKAKKSTVDIPEVFSAKLQNVFEADDILVLLGLNYSWRKICKCIDCDGWEYVFWKSGTEEPTEFIEAIEYTYTDDYQSN